MGNTQKIFHHRVERRMSSMQHVDGQMGYRNIPRRKVPGRRRNGDNVDLHLQTSEYGSCYIATRPILDLCLEAEHRPVSRVPKSVVTRILKFSQRNGKLPLPQWKQDNYPVNTIYVSQWWEQAGLDLTGLRDTTEDDGDGYGDGINNVGGGAQSRGGGGSEDCGNNVVTLKILEMEPSSPLSSGLGVELHHRILSMLGGHGSRVYRER